MLWAPLIRGDSRVRFVVVEKVRDGGERGLGQDEEVEEMSCRKMRMGMKTREGESDEVGEDRDASDVPRYIGDLGQRFFETVCPCLYITCGCFGIVPPCLNQRMNTFGPA